MTSTRHVGVCGVHCTAGEVGPAGKRQCSEIILRSYDAAPSTPAVQLTAQEVRPDLLRGKIVHPDLLRVV